MYTYDSIPLPQFKTHEVISPSKIVNIEQSDSTVNISLSELPIHYTYSLKNHEQPACTSGSLSGSSKSVKAKLGENMNLKSGNTGIAKTGKQIVLVDFSSLSRRPMPINNIPHQIYSVPADGNCFFHSLSLLIHGDLRNSFFFRNIILCIVFAIYRL